MAEQEVVVFFSLQETNLRTYFKTYVMYLNSASKKKKRCCFREFEAEERERESLLRSKWGQKNTDEPFLGGRKPTNIIRRF